MAQVRQFYGDVSPPMSAPATPDEVVDAWQGHRARLRAWLADLPADAWRGPTRCAGWDVTALVRHLISGSQFLGYTLHEAAKGRPTRLLQGFDPQGTPAAAAALIPDAPPAVLVAQLQSMDDNVERECVVLSREGWDCRAEAPLGNVPARLSVNHFLFDSWVHEYDLMLPLGETPLLDDAEAAAVLSYALALAAAVQDGGTATLVPATVDVTATDIAVDVRVTVQDGRSTTSIGTNGNADARIRGRVVDIIDVTTGRTPDQRIDGDDTALAVLRGFGSVMAGGAAS